MMRTWIPSAATLLFMSFVSFASVAQETVVTPAHRKSLALTIYNNGVGLVRESRQFPLDRRARTTIRFDEVSPAILAQSVSVNVSPKPDAVRIIEQAYRYDILSPRTLTEHADGAPITLLRVHPGSGELVRVQGESLASFSSGTPVLRTAEGITFYHSQLGIAFDKLPARWSSQPSLSWLVEVREPGLATFNLAYLSGQMGWEADYVLTLGRSPSDPASLVGWITLTNNSAMSFPQSHIAVVAGQVHLVNRMMAGESDEREESNDVAGTEGQKANAVRSTLGDYHLYDLPENTDLPARSSKQVRFLATSQLHPRVQYVAEPYRFAEQGASSRGATTSSAVDAELRFDVRQSEGLGVPMPQGTVRVLSPDGRGTPQLIAQPAIQHTPRDETVKLRLGPAPEVRITRVLVDRTRSTFRRDDRVQYRLVNSKDVEVMVEVRERDGALQRSTIPSTSPDAATTLFEVRVPARGQVQWEADFREGR